MKKRTLELKVEDGSGEFNLQMGLFKDDTFIEEYNNFPVTVPLNDRLFFQLNVDSADRTLTIVADTCFATPTRFPSADNGYIIIKDRYPIVIFLFTNLVVIFFFNSLSNSDNSVKTEIISRTHSRARGDMR